MMELFLQVPVRTWLMMELFLVIFYLLLLATDTSIDFAFILITSCM